MRVAERPFARAVMTYSPDSDSIMKARVMRVM